MGQLDYDDITTILGRQSRWMTAPERRVVAGPDRLPGVQTVQSAQQVDLDDKITRHSSSRPVVQELPVATREQMVSLKILSVG